MYSEFKPEHPELVTCDPRFNFWFYFEGVKNLDHYYGQVERELDHVCEKDRVKRTPTHGQSPNGNFCDAMQIARFSITLSGHWSDKTHAM